MNAREKSRQAEVVAALRPALDTAEYDDWDDHEYDDQPNPDPCNHCPHDNTRHRGDGCLDCGCDVSC